jgi:hypothetical protein
MQRSIKMFQQKTVNQTVYLNPGSEMRKKRNVLSFFSKLRPPCDSQPSLIHFNSVPLFRLEKTPEKYAHLLKKKDVMHIGPLVSYFIRNSGHAVYLGGDAVRNFYLHGRRKYKALNMLAILTSDDIDKYTFIMNNIISSNDGAFSLGFKYMVRKNRAAGCFKEVAVARYIIEPSLDGLDKLLYLFRPAPIELDLTTRDRCSQAFGGEPE